MWLNCDTVLVFKISFYYNILFQVCFDSNENCNIYKKNISNNINIELYIVKSNIFVIVRMFVEFIKGKYINLQSNIIS